MSFPTADRYNEAVQNPRVFFSDPAIQARVADSDAYGLPIALSGGFAYTYRFTGGGTDIAVRCFHKAIPQLFERYDAIARFLDRLNSRFFVDFAFHREGVRIEGSPYPVVRMRWIQGETLLEFVARNRSNRAALEALRGQIAEFAHLTEVGGFAHGDVQHRNILVAADGGIKFVDYDAMFVPALRGLSAADNGHPHFQSPMRRDGDFGPGMDRFPIAVLDLSLKALTLAPELFDKFHRGENLIISRDDLLHPESSSVLATIAALPQMGNAVARFVDCCRLPAREMLTLEELRSAEHVARPRPVRAPAAPAVEQRYVSPFTVVDGMTYSTALRSVGRPVEMIGQIKTIRKEDKWQLYLLRFGDRYADTPTVVVPFSLWGHLSSRNVLTPGAWISASGILQSHTSRKYRTVQIMLGSAADLEVLSDESEARFRLGKTTRTLEPLPSLAERRDEAAESTNRPKSTQRQDTNSRPRQWKITRSSTPAPTQNWGISAPQTPSHSGDLPQRRGVAGTAKWRHQSPAAGTAKTIPNQLTTAPPAKRHRALRLVFIAVAIIALTLLINAL